MVLKANDRRTSCPCHDEFRGPRSDYVRHSYTRAFGDGPRNFNHSQVTWTTPELAPLLTTTSHQREDVSALDRFNVHRCPHTAGL
ncbi:hypothetical protein TNCV_2616591 [Trichonephila clavipes]|nr:hypothetical protein TNCV_2616591 [Trichonephila clavipes]